MGKRTYPRKSAASSFFDLSIISPASVCISFPFHSISKLLLSPTFAIRIEKQSFLGIHRLETLDFTGVDFQNGL
mgnify:CR=1 FL=1